MFSQPSLGGLNHTWSSSLDPPKEGSKTTKGKLSNQFRENGCTKGWGKYRLQEVQGQGEERSQQKRREKGCSGVGQKEKGRNVPQSKMLGKGS